MAQVGMVFDEVRGASVAPQMGSHATGDASLLPVMPDHDFDGLTLQRSVRFVRAQPQGLLSPWRGAPAVAHLLDIALNTLASGFSKRHHAVLGKLGMVDAHETGFGIDVGQEEMAHLLGTEPGAVECLKHGSVAQADRSGRVPSWR